VGLLLWPVSTKDNALEEAASLTKAQQALFDARDAQSEERTQKHQQMLQAQQALTQILGRINSSSEESFSRTQWSSVLHDFEKTAQYLTLLSYHDKTDFADSLSTYIPNIDILQSQIKQLFDALINAWQKNIPVNIPEPFTPKFNQVKLEVLSELDRGALSSTIEEMTALHHHLRSLATKLNALNSPQPTRFLIEKTLKEKSRFLWLDIEHLKGSIVTFLVFWTGVLLWVYINPPGGFVIVTLATGLTVITTFTPVKPSQLIIVFTMAFLFATVMYILVQPNLTYGWNLALFIFFYGMIGFYFINPKISIFFLLGMTTFNLTNEMYYAFDLFLLILLVFYAFLFLLLLFYYIPFSTKPEQLFLTMKDRLFSLSATLLEHNHNRIVGKETLFGRLKAAYARHHLMQTVRKMQLWASQIDEKYFDTIDKAALLQFTKSCESFAYMLQTMYLNDRTYRENPLVKAFLTQNQEYTLVPLLKAYAQRITPTQIDKKWQNKAHIIARMEARLKAFDKKNDKHHTQEQIMHFYTTISLHKNVWIALFTCSEQMVKLDFKQLEESRF
jgi:hypothetical protein